MPVEVQNYSLSQVAVVSNVYIFLFYLLLQLTTVWTEMFEKNMLKSIWWMLPLPLVYGMYALETADDCEQPLRKKTTKTAILFQRW